MDYIKLDNPVWHSLNEAHSDLSIDFQGIKFYKPKFCPFGGIIDIKHSEVGVENYSKIENNFFVVGTKPSFSSNVMPSRELICYQMILDKNLNISLSEELILLNSQNQKDELFDLVNQIQPGYFKSNTVDCGDYYGIYKDGKLVAAAGERMKMNGFTEISAVVTHPNYAGRGFASQLISQVANKIFVEGKTPYLHVAETNKSAIRLYEKLGFELRILISFWNFKTNLI